MINKKLIYLAGFMGAGKSTIGSILANALGMEFYDLDKLIEQKCGKKITVIFRDEGESSFRNTETEILKEVSKKNSAVISLGGGTMISERNLDIMKSTGIIIYLSASLESVYKRLRFKRDRPVLNLGEGEDQITKEMFLAQVKNLFELRKPYYERADIIIDTDEARVGATVDKLIRLIEKKGTDIK